MTAEREGADAPAGSRRRRLALASVLVSFAATLGVLECGLRIASGDPLSRPDVGGAVRMVGGVYPGIHEPRLGYVPEPGRAADDAWGTRVTIDARGLRSNGPGEPPGGEPLLAVGDSFTFGDEVSDHETWPARLEARSGRRVLNGGVFGYGFDQIVLRAERLLESTGARTLLVSFTADDVRRCEYAYRYAWKPWFAVVDGALALRGVPVPEPGAPPPGESLPRRLLRHSHLADLVMRRLDPQDWLLPDGLRVHRQGVSVGRLLVDRLADAAAEHGHALLLVHQWHPLSEVASAVPLLERARQRGVPVLETEILLRREMSRHPEGAESLFHIDRRPGGVVAVGHMSPVGNDVVARVIEERLRRGLQGPGSVGPGGATRPRALEEQP